MFWYQDTSARWGNKEYICCCGGKTWFHK